MSCLISVDRCMACSVLFLLTVVWHVLSYFCWPLYGMSCFISVDRCMACPVLFLLTVVWHVLSYFCWPLYGMSCFDLRLLITRFVSLNLSWLIHIFDLESSRRINWLKAATDLYHFQAWAGFYLLSFPCLVEEFAVVQKSGLYYCGWLHSQLNWLLSAELSLWYLPLR